MMNRREALLGIGAGTAGVLAGVRPFRYWADTLGTVSAFEPDVDIALVAAPDAVQLRPGARTRVWRFTGSVIKGAANSVQAVPNSYIGPTLRFKRGQKIRIRFRNNLAEPSIVHWHGLDVPELADGHPRFAIAPGAEYVYEFEVINRAGTYWYHPHAHGSTGKQVYQGLAGMLVVTDDGERALALPSGNEDLVCLLQDRTIDSGNQFAYLAGGMMDQMHGLLGTTMLVNGQERASFALATRAYRFRILNASSSRVYKLTWDDGTPMTVVGADGGLLARPLQQPFLTLAPSQRADVILDLSNHAVGTSIQLRSAPFTGSEVSIDESGMMGGRGRGMMGGMMGGTAGTGTPNGASLLLMTVQVSRKEQSAFRLPAQLSNYGPEWAEQAGAPVRNISLDFRAGQWLLGGRVFDMMGVAPDEIVRAGSTHIWEIKNVGGMMGQQMAHPLHVHGTQFRVLSRTRPADATTPAQSVREGLVDEGWRDTVLVMPNDTLRLQLRFTQFPGMYLYHCHILEHEDAGMMRNFKVTA